jgi:hypothetical protein
MVVKLVDAFIALAAMFGIIVDFDRAQRAA